MVASLRAAWEEGATVRKQTVLIFVMGMLCGGMLLGGGVYLLQRGSDLAQAQGQNTWQTAGGDEGFNIADWGTGRGKRQSLDEWVESLPASCDIQTIPRGVSYVSVIYRCPES